MNIYGHGQCSFDFLRTVGYVVMLDAGRVHPGLLEVARISDYAVASEEFAVDLGWDLTLDAFRSAEDISK